jgi:hypothetical protein
MIVKLNQKEYKITWITTLYALILLFFLFYTLRDLSYNTAFVDEAIYATIGEEVLRGIYWESALSWMGGSYLYPLVSATINHSFGLAGIRLFSALCVFWAGIVAGKIGRKIAGTRGEVLSVGLFFSSSIVINLAQMGTYDALSLALLSLSFYFGLASKETDGNKKLKFLIPSALFFTLSVLSKYVAILFIPLFFIFLYEKEKIKFIKNFLSWFLVFYITFGTYVWHTFDSLKDYFTGTNFSEPTPFWEITQNTISMLNVFLLGAFISAIVLFKKYPKHRWLILSLLLAGLVLPAYHFLSLNARSMWKHLVFTTFFWSPITAWVILKGIRITSAFPKRKAYVANIGQLILSLGVVAITTNLWLSFSNHWRFQRSWPSATTALEYLQENRKPEDIIFAEGSAVYKYHLFTGFEDPSSWSSTWYLDYKGLTGTVAMKKAIEDKHFHFIVLNYYFTNDLDAELKPVIEKYYTLAITDVYKISGIYDNKTEVWIPK